jgi:hypothetical protein
MSREVALAIGVGDAPPLEYLSGAVNGARTFHDWASNLGYESTLLVDDENAVTMTRLRLTLLQLLGQGQPIHRLVLYFAGHGLILELEQGLWLLSDWRDELRAVAVEKLKRRLSTYYDIKQIAIFADCCRSLPKNVQDADLTEDGVIGLGPSDAQDPTYIDKFIAAQDGMATFVVPGASPEEDRCVFSGVLMEGLWGKHPRAFSPSVQNAITSRSLEKYLRDEVPKLTSRYGRKLKPSVSATFPDGDDIYFPAGFSGSPPKFPDWPPPSDLLGPGQGPGGAPEGGPKGPKGGPKDGKGKKGGYRKGGKIILVLEEYCAKDLFVQLAAALGGPVNLKKGKKKGKKGGPKGPKGKELAFGQEESAELELPSEAEDAGQILLDEIRRQPRPEGFSSGFAVHGGSVRELWTPSDVVAEKAGRDNWWQVRMRGQDFLNRATPVLIEFEDGMFAATTALPSFIASVFCDARGISALICRPAFGEKDTAAVAEKALASMESGNLRVDALSDLAVGLRQEKHYDPVLGVISAYLYDSIGDIANIRRMAYYYTWHHQPIPYDIALLAQLPSEWRDGRLWAEVPEVAKQKPRTESKKKYPWTYEKTPASQGEVGGFWPWMRQGWTFLDDPADNGSTLIRSELLPLRQHLGRGRFAMLDAEGGRSLATIFNLSQQLRVRAPARPKRKAQLRVRAPVRRKRRK